MSFYSFCISLGMEYCQFSSPSQRWRSGEDVVAVVLSLLPLQAWALERILPGRHTEARREVLRTAPGTLPLEIWELRKRICPIRDESQLFISFNLSSTVLLDNVFIYKEKVYTLNLFLYRVCGSLSLAYDKRLPLSSSSAIFQCWLLKAKRNSHSGQNFIILEFFLC